MRKWLVVLLCFCLILGVIGCSNSTDTITTEDGTKITIEMPDKIPKDFSKEFYRDMLVANELIEKSKITKYIYLNKEFDVGLMKYYYPLHKDEITKEDEEYIKKNNVDINRDFTLKEEHTFNLLWDISMDLFSYHVNPNSERLKQIIEDQHKQFKVLLEIEEPK